MHMRCLIAATIAITAVLSHTAQARDWGTVSGWSIASGTQSCGMYAQQRSSAVTDVVFLKRMDGSIVMQLQNPAWNIPAGAEPRIQYRVNNRAYLGPVSAAGMANNPGRALVAVFSSDFERELRGNEIIALTLDGRLIDQVSLSGSAAALLTVQNCLDELQTPVSNTTASRNADVDAGFTALSAKAPVPRNAPAGWVSIEDYPASAQRERREGSVGFRLSVDLNGRVGSCIITKSSGSADLDEATCKSVSRRARFTPASDANGAPTSGIYESRVTWKPPGG
jgi:TonB family protein